MAHTIASFDAGHSDTVHDVQFDYYGRRLATASSDRTIKVFDVVGEQVVLSTKQYHRKDIFDCKTEWATSQLSCWACCCRASPGNACVAGFPCSRPSRPCRASVASCLGSSKVWQSPCKRIIRSQNNHLERRRTRFLGTGVAKTPLFACVMLQHLARALLSNSIAGALACAGLQQRSTFSLSQLDLFCAS